MMLKKVGKLSLLSNTKALNVIRIILSISFLCLCFGSLFLKSSLFVDEHVTPKWYLTYLFSLIIVLIYVIDYRRIKVSFLSTSFPIFSIALSCTLQAIYGIIKLAFLQNSFEPYAIGSFENPAGFAACLCAGIPFIIYFTFNKKIWIKYLAFAAIVVVIIAVILSTSRTGIISMVVVLLAVLFYRVSINIRFRILILFLTLVISISSLYLLKKDSANGRLLIWLCTVEMIKEKPFTGYGVGGFRANYMNFQAKYFDEHPNSRYVKLADNINRPFNEYLALLSNHGIVGLLLFVAATLFLLKSFCRCKNSLLTNISIWCLLCIAIFSFFSYPLRYPFVWVIVCFSIIIIINHANYDIKISLRIINLLRLFLLCLISTAIIFTFQRIKTEIQWKRIAHNSLLGKTDQMLPIYNQLYKSLSNNALFLYNYAAELNVAKKYDKSLTIAQECELIWADYELQILIADIYQKKQNYIEAEKYLKKASSMCPIRFIPLYKLVEIYRIMGRDEEAKILAQRIINKEIKIPSPTVYSIKNEMIQFLKEQ